jgi:hypothetical protein
VGGKKKECLLAESLVMPRNSGLEKLRIANFILHFALENTYF